MTIEKLVAGQKGNVLNSTGSQVRDTVNALVDAVTGDTPFEKITLKGLPQTAGAPAGYGDLASAVRSNYRPQVDNNLVSGIDLHYGALMGVGWRNGEAGSAVEYTLSSASAAGSKTLNLTDASTVVAGQLMCVMAGDRYWTHYVVSKSTNQLTISPALRADAQAVYNFYANESHPNVYGYRAICDYAISHANVQEIVVTNCYIRRNLGSATITQNTSNSALNVGSASVSAYDVTTTNVATQGLYGNIVLDSEGDYVAEVSAFSATSDVRVYVSAPAGFSEIDIPAGAMGRYQVAFSTVGANQNVTIRVAPVTSGATATVGELVKIKKINRSASALGSGVHVLVGDSWFVQTGFAQRLAQWLPAADIINKAVGGRTSANILNAFDADLAGINPDFVWYICGTNDYYGSVAATTFQSNFNKTKCKILALGAKPIMFNSSVGSADLSTSRFDLSRQYATVINNDNAQLQPSFARFTYSIPLTTLANGASQQLVNMGFFVERVSVNYYYVNGAGISLRAKQNLTGSGTSLLALTDNVPTATVTNHHFDGNRWLDLFANNTSGGSLTYTGFITVTRDF